ncbi:hypothetical protein MKX01_008688 [Papaver californicum]|nr:hypothetical protein MKX01_008688 [Papaver californicum]
MIPILDFAHQMSLHNLTITVLIMLPFPNHPRIPQGVENVKDLSPNLFYTMLNSMSGLYNPILEWFKSHPSPPVAIISDFFLGWTHHLACELGIPPKERGGSGSVSTDDIISWLDTRPDTSGVHVCFGSQVVLCNKQMEGLASGLESSGVRFLRCVKEPTTGHVNGKYSVVPAGFEDRTAGKGMLLRGWAPQLPILKHRSVGSFMTHCGWNSVLEGLTSGVVMLAWPMRAEQFVNATLLVDQVKVAVRVLKGLEVRVRAMELCKASLTAVEDGGSSFMDLDSFVKALAALMPCSS